jgi:hypothetical protein
MRYALVTIIWFLIGATPALSAPAWVEDYCRRKAFQADLSGRGDGEAFMARCIADLTPPPGKRSKYKKPHY